MTRRLGALAAAVALTAGTLAACGDSGDAKNAAIGKDGSIDFSKVTLHLGDQKGAGLQALLNAAGQLNGVKYKVNWAMFTSGPPILEAINAGAVDFGYVGNTPPIFSAAARSNIRIVGAFDISLAGQAILVPKGSTLRTAADLKGKKIAVAKGSSAHGHLLSVLKKNGLSLNDVQPQYLQPSDSLAAFSAGKIDALAIWEPYTAQVEAQTGGRILLDGNGYTNGYAFAVTSKKVLGDKARTAALKDFVGRYQRAIAWADAHRPEWAKLWAQQTGLSVPVSQKAVDRKVTKVIPIDDTVVNSEQQLADLFSDAKVLPGKVKIDDFFDRRFNDLATTSGKAATP
ncbi:ABC transporter substrate-binding protein [Actinomadura barringtoniae]|uniref:Putative aliphatic sulfonates-binding protein n=1 Tax=Actinomadura barringtoniae TaxID=1427535 RepID=A0A939T845_9ACTN|nr:ABC transporter substrate-binding protein [Actinomadura barringtoniae]